MTATRFIFGVLLLLTAHPLFADGCWVLVTADFHTQSAVLRSIDDTGVTISAVGADATNKILFDQFLQLDRATHSRVGTGKFLLHLSGGTKILGDPAGYQDEQVIWNSPAVGELKVSLKEARALVRNGKSADNI